LRKLIFLEEEKMKKSILISIIGLAFFAAQIKAYDFDSGGTVIIDYEVDGWVDVDSHVNNIPGTHLILEDGAYIGYGYELNAFNNSQVTINGGTVVNRVNGYGQSQLTINGGTLSDVIAWDNSKIIVTNNANALFVMADGSGSIFIDGGTTKYSIEAYENSNIYISGGNFADNSANLYAIENGIITLEGSNFKIGNVEVTGLLNIPYMVSAGALVPWGDTTYHHYYGILTGTLADGTALDNAIEILHRPNGDVYMDKANFNFVPEPATIALLTLGGLVLRKRK
jgi:hypothetical protein